MVVDGTMKVAEGVGVFSRTTLLSVSSDLSYSSLYIYTAAILFETLLYGIYVALFGVCINVLLSSKKTTQRVMLACAIAMFALATIDIVLAVSYLYWFVIKQQEIPDDNIHFKYLIFITSNCIADSLVIYRCYTVWNNSKRVIFMPCFMLLAGSACGYTFIGLAEQEYRFRDLLKAFLFVTVVLNLMVTALMAGRIWWIGRKAHAILGPGLSGKYKTAAAIIVESGMIYSIYVMVDVLLDIYPLDAGLCQVVGMVPTLIIVQIGLGRTAHNVDTTVTNMQTEAREITTCEPEFDPPPPMSEMCTELPSPIHSDAPEYRENDPRAEFDHPSPMSLSTQYRSRIVEIEAGSDVEKEPREQEVP